MSYNVDSEKSSSYTIFPLSSLLNTPTQISSGNPGPGIVEKITDIASPSAISSVFTSFSASCSHKFASFSMLSVLLPQWMDNLDCWFSFFMILLCYLVRGDDLACVRVYIFWFKISTSTYSSYSWDKYL